MPSVRANIPWSIYFLLGTVFFGIVMSIAFSNSLVSLLHEPLMTPDAWLESHPYLQIDNHVVSEPSSSVLIFLLAFLYLRVAYLFFRGHDGQQSRLWWGIFMLLFGLGAILAGVSYQAFSFELKCRGYDYCLWTSWWEIGYMICTVAGVGAAFIAAAYSVLSHMAKLFWTAYALASTLIYIGVVSFGIIFANRFLISFEMMIIFILVGFITIAANLIWQYRHNKNPLIMKILKVGVLLIAVIVIYFVGLTSGYAELLWARGIWFNANDLLHVLLFGWVLYSYNMLHETLLDS
jgi:MFS family permease